VGGRIRKKRIGEVEGMRGRVRKKWDRERESDREGE
jgi:hypothetical protein